jgi:3-oxoacyl-[acyl-carrier-protein] synthase III
MMGTEAQPLSVKPSATDQQIWRMLFQDVLELTAQFDEATNDLEAVTRQIPRGVPHSDEVRRIKTASNRLSIARKKLMKALRRLNHFEPNREPSALAQAIRSGQN